MNEKEKTCCLCGKKFRGFGNNPYPLRTRGRCCDECNEQVIIARLVEHLERTTK